jgi:hypothetical protein
MVPAYLRRIKYEEEMKKKELDGAEKLSDIEQTIEQAQEGITI